MSNDSGNRSSIQTSDDYNLPEAKRRKVSPHKQQNNEKEYAAEVISELNIRIHLFCAGISSTIMTKNLRVDTGKTERKLKRQHFTSILTIAHLRNARDLLKSALNEVLSTSHRISTNESLPADNIPPTLHQIQINRSQPVDNSPNQIAKNSSEIQSTPSPSKVKSIMKTTETSPSMIQIQNMNEQVGVFISYIENVLINCNGPLNEHKKLLVNALVVCADVSLKMVEMCCLRIEHEFKNNLEELADRNPFPLYLDDKEITEDEKALIRESRQPINFLDI